MLRRCVAALGLLAGVSLARAEQSVPLSAPLQLPAVLASVEAHHPLIAVERANVEAAEAEARSARGEFDPTLTVEGRGAPAGYYDPRRFDMRVDQPTPVLGASLYAGYRVTKGKVADYYGEQRTLSGGELRGGLRVPVLQGRSIDGRRAGVQSSRALARASDQAYQTLILDMERQAAQIYYGWVAAGRRLAVLKDLLKLAETRDSQVRQKVELGALPPIEQLDNRRTILERQRQVITARRTFEKAAIDLSLYLRDASGQPLLPAPELLPPDLTPHAPPVAPAQAEERALLKRPELAQAEALIEVARVEQLAANNNVQPRLDVFGEASRDFGTAAPNLEATLAPTVIEVGVTFSLPMLLRKARGKLAAAEAKLGAAEQKSAFARDKVRAEVRDALSQLLAAEERANAAREGAEMARLVADGERERFELGATTVLFVNIREQAAADAQISLLDAVLEVGAARARLVTSMGERLSQR